VRPPLPHNPLLQTLHRPLKAVERAREMQDDKPKMRMLRRAFDLFDLDGGGSIEGDELCTLLKGLGIQATEEEALAMIQEVQHSTTLTHNPRGAPRGLNSQHLQVDDDGSGEIEFEEFVVLMQKFMARDADEIEHVWKAQR
jgi:Ca2+-binding EF-hand superfamily protein